MAQPRTIHDFYGFPPSSSPCGTPHRAIPTSPEEVAEIVKPTWIGLDHDCWGIDHGAWSVLLHVFPDADVPVVQLSINVEKPLDYHLDLGRSSPRCARRRADRRQRQRGAQPAPVDWSQPDGGFDWARRFDKPPGRT